MSQQDNPLVGTGQITHLGKSAPVLSVPFSSYRSGIVPSASIVTLNRLDSWSAYRAVPTPSNLPSCMDCTMAVALGSLSFAPNIASAATALQTPRCVGPTLLGVYSSPGRCSQTFHFFKINASIIYVLMILGKLEL